MFRRSQLTILIQLHGTIGLVLTDVFIHKIVVFLSEDRGTVLVVVHCRIRSCIEMWILNWEVN